MQPRPKEPIALLIKLLYVVLAISLFVLAFYAWENFARSPEAEVKRQLCLYKRVCRKYASSRQDCAVAGDFQNCLQIRMGGEMRFVSECTNDGGIKNLNTDSMPSMLECIMSSGRGPP